MTERRFKPQLGDITIAFALLTRLPLPYPAFDPAEKRAPAHAAWAYPLVGIAVAVLMTLVIWVGSFLSVPLALSAALALLAGILTTGAMHEDGLADCADGFWGGWTKDRRLEIMKDSQIGTYGVIALTLSLLMRWYLLWQIAALDALLPALLVAATLSRAAMVWIMHKLANARGSGLSDQTGRPPVQAAGLAVLPPLLAGLIGLPGALIPLVAVTLVTTLGCQALARRKIGGQTGDVLGATQQVVEIAALITALAVLTPS